MLLDLLRNAELCQARCNEILKGPISLNVRICMYIVFVSLFPSFWQVWEHKFVLLTAAEC